MFDRDANSNALVAIDAIGRDNYRLERKRLKEFKALQAEVASLKEQLSEINKVLAQLIKEKK